MIRLPAAKARRFTGVFRYLIAYDYAAGRSNRYTVLILNVDDPVTVGRELPLPVCKALIRDYEETAYEMGLIFMGDRRDVLKCMKKVTAKRRALAKRSNAKPSK